MSDFNPQNVVYAYQQGIFPMYSSDECRVSWYRPTIRTILPLDGFHVSRSLAKTIRRGRFEVRIDSDFQGVMRGCADRPEGTWISEEFYEVFGALHDAGLAHSVEAWSCDRLVGGTYGLALGGAFMAESMFHYRTDASKVALAALVSHLRSRGFALLDVQLSTDHILSLGAIEIPHELYQRRLNAALRLRTTFWP